MGNLHITIVSMFLAVSGLTLAGSPDAISQVQSDADNLVQQLRQLPTPLPAGPRSDGTVDPVEQRRHDLYLKLRQLGADALPALARGLRDPDVQLRRNVALVLGVLGGTWYSATQPKMDIVACLPELVMALRDSDHDVRSWAAQAIGNIGPNAAQAVPALITLLRDSDEGPRNSACIALFGIGPPAKEALPALRLAVIGDPSKDVRKFAQRAIEKIEGQQ